jgi:hypothetical protein
MMAQSFVGILMKDLLQQILQFGGKLMSNLGYLMEFRTSVDYGFEQFHAILAAEGRKATYHFVYEASQTPPVHIESVAYLLYDFRGKVLGCTAYGVGGFLILEYLRQAEVS